ncbi:glutathione peroxidase [Rhodospirillum rubrum]|uniref:Glutathione peroxidase n=1 Tax=Rhodospirillum rubrum (strain ATCC 11170 / ATH 1.1.1 / DSM 467 / LMG 4362 / NCIMB 8255 / S1) TaxID=269796 RepID=Q2RT82_RHORT|nr:glutathione peroxidase [Rhodospirillum rubrum]ABC22663.1 Glutathione peroxidase [Rhodospirillum rubrum ATCC 11170]AEO48381.1 glutathione peroxidase [Rhodospirillum rubrum F11]MBK5954260.1 glutathione peroxidase [Rhodospirillum rubrum]QXG82284.1 glutathione peroxidase [Rhodospirillum rubrum]HCF16468.1 glutathione peroxidase [Rhodospirillum rubrum]
MEQASKGSGGGDWLIRGVFSLGLALASFGGPASAQAAGAHDYSFPAIDGGTLPLAAWAGHPVLVVNTASECGFTAQYEGLEALWKAYRAKGLIVLGVPSNDFGGQEPGSAAEIKDFCESTFAVDFPLTDKTAVSGARAHPFYAWAKASRPDLSAPRWNFHKYLIAPDGSLAASFSALTDPKDRDLTDAIDKLLEK